MAKKEASAKAQISKKASIKVKDRMNPVPGGPVGVMGGHQSNGTLDYWNKVNAEKPDIKEGPKVKPRDYIEDYHQRGYWAPKKGEVRVLEQQDYDGRGNRAGGSDKILNQLNKAARKKK